MTRVLGFRFRVVGDDINPAIPRSKEYAIIPIV